MEFLNALIFQQKNGNTDTLFDLLLREFYANNVQAVWACNPGQHQLEAYSRMQNKHWKEEELQQKLELKIDFE